MRSVSVDAPSRICASSHQDPKPSIALLSSDHDCPWNTNSRGQSAIQRGQKSIMLIISSLVFLLPVTFAPALASTDATPPRKSQKSSRLDVQRRQVQTETVPLIATDRSLYIVTATIGGQNVSLLPDTGSSALYDTASVQRTNL